MRVSAANWSAPEAMILVSPKRRGALERRGRAVSCRSYGRPLDGAAGPVGGAPPARQAGTDRRRRLRSLHPRPAGHGLRARRPPPRSASRTAIGVANGTDALALALRALGVEPGDEVICPSYTFYATAEAIAAVGRVAGVRRHRRRLQPRPGGGRARRSRRTRAVVAVHLFGHPADLDRAARAVRPRRRRRWWRTRPRRSAPAGGVGPVGDVGDVLVLPDEEPGDVRRRRPHHDAARGRRGHRAGCSASTARGTSRRSRRSATTRASTSCRPRCCACSSSSRAGTPPARPPPRGTASSASTSTSTLPPDGGDLPPVHGARGRARARRRGAARRPASAAASTTGARSTCSPCSPHLHASAACR